MRRNNGCGAARQVAGDSARGSEARPPNSIADLPVWDLSDLYGAPDDPALIHDLERLRALVEDFVAAYRGRVTDTLSPPALAEAIRRYEDIEALSDRLMAYADLVYAENAKDPAAQKCAVDMRDHVTALAAERVFFRLDVARLEAPDLTEETKDPALRRYAPWLRVVRAGRPYQLSGEVERLFVEKETTARAAWVRLFDDTVASLKVTIDGTPFSVEAALQRLSHPDGETRRAAAEALAETFADHISTFALVFNTIAKDRAIEADWRGYPDMATPRHLANQVEAPVVEALVTAVTRSYPRLSHRYYTLKAKWMGQAHLHYWDRNAPLERAETAPVPWAEARECILAAFDRFSPDMAVLARRFFDHPWIDAPLRDGKAPGAFSHPTVPGVHPYILVNYAGRQRDVMTLAHELGHGVHQILAAPQGALMAQTPLTLAETASVFGEMLTFQALLEAAPDRAARRSLLAAKVEDMLNTVVRQIAFYTFERRIHQERRAGEVPAQRIGEIWCEVQAESLGPALRLDPGYETYWCYVSHFIHVPFYVYAYAFGDCLVNALYAQYRDHPDGFSEKYIEMLKAGGTKHHTELLAPFGLDARDPGFWSRGLDMIEDMIGELESLE